MWVNDTEQANIRMFEVGEDGRLRNGKVFASGIKDAVKAGVPDGMKADANGNVWVTAPGGVWVYSFEGLLIGKIEVPEMVANLHWGGEDWQTLFMCACTSVYRMRTRVRPRTDPLMQPKAVSNAPGPVLFGSRQWHQQFAQGIAACRLQGHRSAKDGFAHPGSAK